MANDQQRKTLYLSKYITVARTRALMRVSGFVVGQLPTTYLGVPLVFGEVTTQVLKFLIYRVCNNVAC